METEQPVYEGQEIENLKITNIGRKGDGIGRVDNFVVIVPETMEGHKYNVKITKVYKNLAFANIHE